MPSKNFFHKNRSQGSLLNIHDSSERRLYQPSPNDSPLHSPVYTVTSASHSPHDDDHDPDQRFAQLSRSDEGFYQSTVPTRTQSQRTSLSTQPYPGHLAPPQIGIAQAALDENPDSFYQQAPTSIAPKDDQRKRRLFGSWSSKEPANNNGGLTSQRLGRNISVRRKPPAPQISTEASSRQVQQRPSNRIAPPESEEAEDRGGAGGNPSHLQPAAAAPPIPEKDPLRSPQFSNIQQQESPYSRAPSQGVVTSIPNRQPLERQESANSTVWENTVRSTQHPYHPPPQSQYHQPQVYQPSPSSATSTSSHPLPARGAHETLPPYYQNSSRPPSRQSFGPPSPLQQNSRADPYGPGLKEPSAYPPASMAPSSQQQQPTGRVSNESQSQRAPGPTRESSGYQNYPPGSQELSQTPNAPPQYREQQLGINNPGNNYRAPPQPSPMAPQTNLEHERSTPPPSRSRDDLAGLDPAQLLVRHDELQEKYRKVKKYYFDKDAQVQQLQNTLAHQRLSQSRTSLDDNEYMGRFQRLDGAINNLSFNLRRDWRAVPPWLGPHVNRDAPTSPTREMTAVGRACISRWLVDELFDRYFHPSLEPPLSGHLKIIEKNLRRFAAPTPSEEEKDALMARISNWRLATLDGLQEILSSSQAAEFRSQLTDQLVEKLTASLSMSLKDPVPAGLEGGVGMIVELAVGIAANLPLESRDVFVNYITPGTLVNEAYMKVESGLPPLTNPGEGLSDGARAGGAAEKTSDDSNTTDPKDNNPGEDGAASTGGSSAAGSVVGGTSSGGSTKETKKKSMFGTFMGGGKKAVGSAPSSGAHQQPPQPPQPPKEDRVRFAAFMAVEVRSKSVLVKAPVFV